MSLTRREPFIAIGFLLSIGLALQAAGAFAAARMDGWSLPRIGTGERFLVDALSGVALRGFDPVAYFETREARSGLAIHEALWSGVAWRFVSQANKAAFEQHPDVYQPRFGGHDADAAGRGLVVEADPTIFALADERLYFFRSQEAKQRFLADRNAAVRAERSWSVLERSLVN